MSTIRRYAFFISSTFRDLAEQRNAVIESVTRYGHFPIGMEFFHAAFDNTENYIGAKILESDWIILILGGYEGSRTPEGLTFVEFEIEFAKQHNIPILAFVLNEEEFRQSNPTDAMQRLWKTIHDLNQPIDYFSEKDIGRLKQKVDQAISSNVEKMRKRDLGGYVRAALFDDLKSRRTLDSNMSQNAIMSEIVDRLSDFNVEIERGNLDAFEKSAMAEFFWSMSAARIFRDKKASSVFFEAGSTIDFTARAFLKLLTEDEYFIKNEGSLKVFCNGAVSKFRFDLRHIQPEFLSEVRYFPQPPFSDRFGKALGAIRAVGKISATEHTQGNRLSDEQVYRDQLLKHANETLPKDCLMCLSVTGLCKGLGLAPYVDSYRNFVFKEVLLSTDRARVLFIDGSKWGQSVREDEIYEFGPLSEFVSGQSSKPLAFLVSTALEPRHGEMLATLEDTCGLHSTETSKGRYKLMYFYNDQFKERYGIFG